MPIYEFNCDKCQHKFEQLIMSQREKPLCPLCSSKKVSRLLSRFRKGGNSDSIDSGSLGGKCAGCGGGNCATCY